LRKVVRAVHQNSPSRLAKDLAGPLCEFVKEIFSGVFANAHQDTGWWAAETYADLVSGSSFKTLDVLSGHTDIYLSLPLKVLQTTPAVARVIIGTLLNACYEAGGAMDGKPLFLLAEVYLFGYMGILATARDAGRKFGAVCQLLYQSVGQIDAQWGKEGRASWYESTSWRSYSAIKVGAAQANSLAKATASATPAITLFNLLYLTIG
jgi:type IV secretion system protein VirD4